MGDDLVSRAKAELTTAHSDGSCPVCLELIRALVTEVEQERAGRAVRRVVEEESRTGSPRKEDQP